MQRIRHAITILVAIIVALTLAESPASGADDAGRAIPSNWRTTSEERPQPRDLEDLASFADPGDAIDEAQARVVHLSTARRVVVAPTKAGQLCHLARDGESTPLQLCGRGFPDLGVAATYVTAPGEPPALIGLVADDVEQVTITLADGSTQQFDPALGAIWWSGDDGDRVVRMDVVRAGATRSDVDLFSHDRA